MNVESNNNINKYFKTDQDKIYLTKKTDLVPVQFCSTLNVINNTDKYLIFKVYINKQKVYSTNPSTSYIIPNGKAEINIKRQDHGETSISDEIFLISGYPIDQKIDNVSFYLILLQIIFILTKNLNFKLDQAKSLFSKEKEGFKLYLDATLERNIRELLINNPIPTDIDDNNRINESLKLLHEGFNIKAPQTEDEYKKTLKEINIRTDEYLNNIQKIKEQINNFQTNNNNYNLIIGAVTKPAPEKPSNKLSLLTFIFLITMGLIIGAFINNKILN